MNSKGVFHMSEVEDCQSSIVDKDGTERWTVAKSLNYTLYYGGKTMLWRRLRGCWEVLRGRAFPCEWN